MPRIIMNRAFIARWTRMPHSTGRLSATASSLHSLSSAAFITSMADADFRAAQVDFDKVLSRPHARIAHELAGVEDSAARDARLTENQHCLVLGVVDCPGLNGRVDLVELLNTKLRRR